MPAPLLPLVIMLSALPPLEDVYRFPDRATVRACLTFNWNFQRHLETRLAGDPDNTILQQALEETRQLHHVWDLLDDVRYEGYGPLKQQHSLHCLRLLLGEEAYQRGLMPPPVPVWRFRPID